MGFKRKKELVVWGLDLETKYSILKHSIYHGSTENTENHGARLFLCALYDYVVKVFSFSQNK